MAIPKRMLDKGGEKRIEEEDSGRGVMDLQEGEKQSL